jgi:hypothetical protein
MDRLDRIALRLDLASTEGLEPYEIILMKDRFDFDSPCLHRSVLVLPDDVQRRVQVGFQFIGRYAYHPVIIGEFAEAHFGVSETGLPSCITYLTSKFDKFKLALGIVSQRRDITPSYSVHGGDVYIPEYGCRVISEDQLVMVERSEQLRKFFGYNMNVAVCMTTAGPLPSQSGQPR